MNQEDRTSCDTSKFRLAPFTWQLLTNSAFTFNYTSEFYHSQAHRPAPLCVELNTCARGLSFFQSERLTCKVCHQQIDGLLLTNFFDTCCMSACHEIRMTKKRPKNVSVHFTFDPTRFATQSPCLSATFLFIDQPQLLGSAQTVRHVALQNYCIYTRPTNMPAQWRLQLLDSIHCRSTLL